MAFKIEYTYQVEIDVTKAIDYYIENASRKIAKSFYNKLIEAEKTLKSISFFSKNPQRFPLFSNENISIHFNL